MPPEAHTPDPDAAPARPAAQPPAAQEVSLPPADGPQGTVLIDSDTPLEEAMEPQEFLDRVERTGVVPTGTGATVAAEKAGAIVQAAERIGDGATGEGKGEELDEL